MIVIVEEVGGQDLVRKKLLVVKMMVQDQVVEEEEPGDQVLGAGETESRGSRKSGRGTTRETDQEEEECLQDADLLHPETGIEEMRELGDEEDETMTLHQDVMIEDKEAETLVAVTLVIETVALHPGTMIAEMMIVLDLGDLLVMVLLVVMLDHGDVEVVEENQETLEIVEETDLLQEMMDPLTGAVEDLLREMEVSVKMIVIVLAMMIVEEDPGMMIEDVKNDLQPENLMTAGPRSTSVR